MKPQDVAQFAVRCLRALDGNAGKPLSLREFSRKQGVPIAKCLPILHRLVDAGILELTPAGIILLQPVEELTVLDILRAVWDLKGSPPAIQLLAGDLGMPWRKTLELLSQVRGFGMNSIING